MADDHDWARHYHERTVAPPEACASYQALYQALQTPEADMHQHLYLENEASPLWESENRYSEGIGIFGHEGG